jgi:hypothetical protein
VSTAQKKGTCEKPQVPDFFERAVRGSNSRPSVPECEKEVFSVAGNMLKLNVNLNNGKDLQIVAMSRFVT